MGDEDTTTTTVETPDTTTTVETPPSEGGEDAPAEGSQALPYTDADGNVVDGNPNGDR